MAAIQNPKRSCKRHRDVEYTLDLPNGDTVYYKNLCDASVHALALAMSGRTVHLDVLVSSKAGAKFYGGDDAVVEISKIRKRPCSTASKSRLSREDGLPDGLRERS